ncbi:MAG: c-type cytochrome [Proteobacteria bacterium]|nr:c-type cytochrome [Pseudomonadota bacterium]MDA0927770.1 c-type cytochrome [Pseudomonadota bacterium]
MHRSLFAIARARGFRPSLLLCASLSVLAACSETVEAPQEVQGVLSTYLQDEEALTRGRLLFQGSCANFCHGDEPEPGEDVDLFDCHWKYGGSNEDIFTIVTSGMPNTRMVGFGNNFPGGQDDLWMIIAYLRTQQQGCDQQP